MIMAITICEPKPTESEETTYSVVYFTIPAYYESFLLKVDDTYAGDTTFIIGEAIVNSSYASNDTFMTLNLPVNFTFNTNATQYSPALSAGGKWIAVWEIVVPNSSGNYSLNLSTSGSSISETIEIIDMPKKTSEWLHNNSDAIFSVGIIISLLLIGFVFAYLFTKVGKKNE